MSESMDMSESMEGTASERRQPPRIGQAQVRQFLDRNFIWALLVLLMAVATIVNPVFLSPRNLGNILIAIVALGCLVIGQSLVLLLGLIDLSTEANMIFAAVLGGVLMLAPSGMAVTEGGFGLAWPIALAAMLSFATLVGLANGLCIARLRMNPFMVTLAMSLILTGFSIAIGQGRRVQNLPEGFRFLGSAQIGPIPVPVVVLLMLFVIAHVVLTRSAFGRKLYAVGSNRRAARAAGIDDVRVILTAYVLCGFLAGFAAYLLVGRLGTATAGISSGGLFISIAAAVVGGVSLFGGRGTVPGMLGGLLMMGTITNALNLAAIPSNLVNSVAGAVILMAVFIDAVRTRRSGVT